MLFTFVWFHESIQYVNAYSGDLFAKSSRGQIESHKGQIESPHSQIESQSQRVSNRNFNRIATFILPITEQLTIARALAVQLPV